MVAPSNLIGMTFGNLKVLHRAENTSSGKTRWACECACGKVSISQGSDLKSGRTRSCGCGIGVANKTRRTTHGLSRTPEHMIWSAFRARCNNTANKRYADYGGRGISVSPEWDSFETFLADMGKRPSADHSIDRINNDGNYEKGNCRWATDDEQRANKRPRRFWKKPTEETA